MTRGANTQQIGLGTRAETTSQAMKTQNNPHGMEQAMQKTRCALVLALLLPIALVVVGGVSAQLPNYYYETIFVGNGAPGFANEAAIVSAWSQWAILTGEIATQGIFADFLTTANPANAVHAAALDSSVAGAIPNRFAPTGALVVAKNIGTGGGVNGFETYCLHPVQPEVNPTHPNYFGSQELLNPVPISFLTPSASGNAIQAMDIANGILPAAGILPFTTDYVVTAEVIANQIWLGVYALTNQMGVPVQPYFVNSTNTQQPGPCQGLVTSNGKVGNLGARTNNDIVFVDGGNFAHAQTFEISMAAFLNPLDSGTRFSVPWQVQNPGLGTIAGIWICQSPTVANAHHVGISCLGTTGNASRLYILHDLSSPHPWTFATQTIVNRGGGPVSHIPTGVQGTAYSQAAQVLFGGLANTGWFVVSGPGGGGGPWTLQGIDAHGGGPWNFSFNYTVGWAPNGTPLADPGLTGWPPVLGMFYQMAMVWVPETNGTNSQIHWVSGIGLPPGVVSTFPHQISPTGNHPGLPALPLPAATPWPATQILPDQKTNSKADYGLFMAGY